MTRPNHDQIQHWNALAGPRWVALQDRLDVQLDPVGLVALDALAAQPGARALDVGCGAGSTSLTLAERVGPTGTVTGVDISAPMLACARARAHDRGLDRVTFVEGDAQTHPFEAAGYDCVFSRFGVMFFDDPVAAFANLRRATVPGGALGFVCWRAMRENPWVTELVDAVRAFVPPPTPPTPGAPGPFSLAPRERVSAVLAAAGWADVSIIAHDTVLRYGGGAELDATVDFATQIGPAATLLREHGVDSRDDVRAALRTALERRLGPDGVTFPGAVWIVRATRPNA